MNAATLEPPIPPAETEAEPQQNLALEAKKLDAVATEVLIRENGLRKKSVSPIANLAAISEITPNWQDGEPTLRELLITEGASEAQASEMVDDLLTANQWSQMILPMRLIQMGANPVLIREMTLPEAQRYLLTFLLQLADAVAEGSLPELPETPNPQEPMPEPAQPGARQKLAAHPPQVGRMSRS